jgi:N-acylneuraminate cytidylyltransferase
MYSAAADNKLKRLLPEMDGITRRQDLPRVYVLNGAIYIAQIDWLRSNKSLVGAETVAYFMPKERSLDIDTAQDFEIFRSKIEGKNINV